MKAVVIKQHDEKDCGAACLAMIAAHFGCKLPLVRYREMINVNMNGASIC